MSRLARVAATHPRWLRVSLLAGALSLFTAAPAVADSVQSSNWAGYATHRSGVRFTRVVGTWRQPTARCVAGSPSFSSVWVGIGGFSINSQALEQIGSEVDCTSSGRMVSSAWYELVPAASRTIHGMTVAPGDELTASVIVIGHRVRMQLRDLTRRTSFTRTLHAGLVDSSSAEWIVEAPSECAGAGQCQTLDLANFGSATFARAAATPAVGRTGSISDRRWRSTRITLATGQRHFIGSAAGGAQASPSGLSSRGHSFTVRYRASSSVASKSRRLRRSAVYASARVRPGGSRVRPGGARLR
ncbi:MAG: G1 family endopeptidase [Actinomycetota bacterium]|nr:G1 family endopeptidase [Actinomycetota bacterium]